MDRVSLSQKYGIFKQNKTKEKRKLKKNTRYFTMDLPCTTSENSPSSCSELDQIRPKKNQNMKRFYGDMTSKLLAMVPPPALHTTFTYSNVPPSNQSLVTQNGEKEICDMECKLMNSVSTEISLEDKHVGPNEKSKKTSIVNCVNISDNGIKGNYLDTNKQNCKKDIRKNGKKKKEDDKGNLSVNVLMNKNKQVASYPSEMNEQQNAVKSKGKRSIVKNAEQDSGLFDQTVSSKNSQSFKDIVPEMNHPLKQSKKHKAREKRKEIENKVIATCTKEQLTQEECKKVPTLSKKKQKSNAQNSVVESISEFISKQIGTSPLFETSKKQNKEASKVRESWGNKNDFDYHERRSGGWNVIDSDQLVENTISLKKIQKSAKRKSNSKMLNMRVCNKQIQKLDVKVPNKPLKKANNSVNQEFCNSQPILVEMSGNNQVSSNTFHAKVFDLKRKTIQSPFNFKSDLKWKPCKNLCSTDKWEVQYGNTMVLSNTEQQLTTELQEPLSNVGDAVAVSMEKELKAVTIENFVNKQIQSESPKNSTKNTEETVVLSDSSGPYQLFDVSGTEVILALPPSSSVFFQGVVKVKVLLGNISVLGLEISHTNPQEYTVYSPYGVSLLGFQSCVKVDTFSSSEEYWDLVQEKIGNTNVIILDKVVKSISPFSSLLLLQSVSETLITFLLKYFPSLNYFPSTLSRSRVGEDSSGILRALFVDPQSTEYKLYKQSSAWDSVTSLLKKQKPSGVRVLAFGGKGVGKSTFLRFLVNQTLPQFKEVLYIDFDIGQCEFTIPGCVSASVIKNPLLGPNFTHLTQPERLIYVGEINVSVCVDRYLQSVQYILDWCRNQPHLIKLPWFINTMGFVQGLGIELAVTIIKMVNPSDVIQIQSSVQDRNFPFCLKFEEVQNHLTSLPSIVSSNNRSFTSFTFHMLPSTAERSDNRNSPWGVQANVARETVVISYFSQVVAPPAFSLLEVKPHVLSFSRLKLCITNEKVKNSDYLSAMNANLVALCKVPEGNSLIPSDSAYPEILEKAPICHCFGFGIVRGVDLEKKKIFIISPLVDKKMKFVNCLVLGSVHLPERIFISQDEARGTIPYVVEGALLPLARGVRPAKSVIKLKN
ncbi:hypothetical protein R5R35_010956 [Gryllus longicercus]|uniref:Polynucleotide 5'-hydroxyl-kinase NOL9 n=1 Tax=Gryllus longicercus TaxID=2509291 RepID=A0AAN9VH04_9ORTH